MINVVAGILIRERKLLIAERPPAKPYAGYWELPGGKREKNESSLLALKREFHEELGIDVLDATLWLQHSHHYPDKTVLLDVWQITAFQGEPYSKENQVLAWVGWDELLGVRILEGNKDFLAKLKVLLGRLD